MYDFSRRRQGGSLKIMDTREAARRLPSDGSSVMVKDPQA
jgi:hypothetical protein